MSPVTFGRVEHELLQRLAASDRGTSGRVATARARYEARRAFVLEAIGVTYEDLDLEARRAVDHLADFGDAAQVGGVVALIRAATAGGR